jgi:hypothetical protein
MASINAEKNIFICYKNRANKASEDMSSIFSNLMAGLRSNTASFEQ